MNAKPPAPRAVVHLGEMASPARLRARAGAMLALPALWIFALLALPSAGLALLAFATRGAEGEILARPTFENFARLLGFGTFGWSADYLRILGRTLLVAGVTSAASLALAWPVAFFIASRPKNRRPAWLALVTIPIFTNLVIRSYAWMLALSGQMPPARLVRALGLIGEDAALYPGAFAVYLGMISSFLPFAVLPIYASVERIDWSLADAARDLYASRARVFRHAILPQTMPGAGAALVLTFIPAIGVFVVPDLLGGSKYMLVGNLIQQQFGASRDWPFGAAISTSLILFTLAGLAALRRALRKGAAA